MVKQLTPRKFERRRFLGTANVRALKDGSTFRAEILNLGMGGAGIYANRFLAVGTKIQLSIVVAGKSVPAEVATRDAQIAAVKVMPDGNMMGISFVHALTDAEVKLLETNVRAPS